MTEYVIHKSSRLPYHVSYSGPTWDAAGIRHLYKERYTDIIEVHEIARLLTVHNGIGFSITKVDEDGNEIE